MGRNPNNQEIYVRDEDMAFYSELLVKAMHEDVGIGTYLIMLARKAMENK